MKTAVLNMKIDQKLKTQAQELAEKLGFSLSSIVNAYLKNFIKEKTVYFTARSEEPSDYMIQALKESEEERKRGEYYSFENPKDALQFLKDVRKGKVKI